MFTSALAMEHFNEDGKRRLSIATRPRQHLISKMLSNRNVPRILSAPGGFGKTTLAMEYARQVFDGVGMLYMDASDPSFICNIDSAVFPKIPTNFEGPLRLLIIDDLPFLDETRRRVFMDALDVVIRNDIEVIVTTIPSNDVFSGLSHDAVLLSGTDLFVNEKEYYMESSSRRTRDTEMIGGRRSVLDLFYATTFEALHPNTGIGEKTSAAKTFPLRAWGIPSIIWGEPSVAAAHCLERFFSERLPSEFKEAAAAIVLLGDGDYSDIAEVGLEFSSEVIEMLKVRYPLFGIDELRRRFSCIPVDLEDLNCRFINIPEDWVSPEGVLAKIVSKLRERGAWKRIAQIAISYIPVEHTLAFLKEYGAYLLDHGCLYEVLALCARKPRNVKSSHLKGIGLEVWASCMSGDFKTAQSLVYDDCSSVCMDIHEAIALPVFGLMPVCGDENSNAAKISLACISKGEQGVINILNNSGDDGLPQSSIAGNMVSSNIDSWRKVVFEIAYETVCMLNEDSPDQTQLESFCDDFAKYDCTKSSPTWRMVLHLLFTLTVDSSEALHSKVEKMLRDAVEYGSAEEHQSYSHALLSRDLLCSIAFEEMSDCERAQLHSAELLLSDILMPLTKKVKEQENEIPASLLGRLVEELACSECICVEENASLEEAKILETKASGNRILQGEMSDKRLYIKLFGGFEAYRDGELLRNEHLDKRQVRQLLAFLILHRGREVSREKIFLEMWPESDFERARNSFYIVWGHLKKALEIDDDNRFVHARESTLAINRELVDSDVFHFEELQRKLMTEPAHESALTQDFMKLEALYKGELLTCDFKSEFFENSRSSFHDMFVDAMVGASENASNSNKPRIALWFARKALELGGKREDAYYALMHSQLLNNQKTNAIKTFNECVEYLESELDVPPSTRMVELYRRARGEKRPPNLAV